MLVRRRKLLGAALSCERLLAGTCPGVTYNDGGSVYFCRTGKSMPHLASLLSAGQVRALPPAPQASCMLAGHFVLQMEARHGRARAQLAAADALRVPESADALGAPLFHLVGLAVGNGLTDPPTQVMRLTPGAPILG